MELRSSKRKTERRLLHVSPGSPYNFDQRNFWKQEVEARMHGAEERVGEETSRASELRPLCKEVWLKERRESGSTGWNRVWLEGEVKKKRQESLQHAWVLMGSSRPRREAEVEISGHCG